MGRIAAIGFAVVAVLASLPVLLAGEKPPPPPADVGLALSPAEAAVAAPAVVPAPPVASDPKGNAARRRSQPAGGSHPGRTARKRHSRGAHDRGHRRRGRNRTTTAAVPATAAPPPAYTPAPTVAPRPEFRFEH